MYLSRSKVISILFFYSLLQVAQILRHRKDEPDLKLFCKQNKSRLASKNIEVNIQIISKKERPPVNAAVKIKAVRCAAACIANANVGGLSTEQILQNDGFIRYSAFPNDFFSV